MELKISNKQKHRSAPILLIAAGLLAGFLNGLLGAGGGIPVVFFLSWFLGEALQDRRDLYANALCVMLPISTVSCIQYAFAGNVQTDGFGVYAIPAIIGGIVGGILLGRLRASVLKKLFGALVIYSGILLVIR